MRNDNLRIPDGFFLGAATSSYQIEGSVDTDGRTPSIWDTYCRVPGRVLNGDNGDIASDHYRRWQEDLDLMAEIGLEAYRFSIAWPRIQPTLDGPANVAGLDFYDKLVDGLLERGIKPMPTLYHWDLPQYLEDLGGWAARGIVDRFAVYTQMVAERLCDRVDTWMTLNEPWCISFLGYGTTRDAPGRDDLSLIIPASHHLNLAHHAASAVLHEASSSARVGIAVNVHHMEPETSSEDDHQATRETQLLANETFLGPLFDGEYSEEWRALVSPHADLSSILPMDGKLMDHRPEFLGLNHYMTSHWRRRAKDEAFQPSETYFACPDAVPVEHDLPRTAMGWEVDTDGIRRLLLEMHDRLPDVPLMIVENGAAYDDILAHGRVHDHDRWGFIEANLRSALSARESGVPLEGYLVWSLLDNFEWSRGRARRFGIVHVDYETQERTLKDSARNYAQLCQERVFPPA